MTMPARILLRSGMLGVFVTGLLVGHTTLPVRAQTAQIRVNNNTMGLYIDAPTTRYHNFGATLGTDGFGIRETSGAMQAKDDAGAWAAIVVGAVAPVGATYITQTPDATLTNEQPLDALASGIMRVDTAAGVITSLVDCSGIAANQSDETGACGGLVLSDTPTLITPEIGVATGTSLLLGSDVLYSRLAAAQAQISGDWADGTANELLSLSLIDSVAGVDADEVQLAFRLTDSAATVATFGRVDVALTTVAAGAEVAVMGFDIWDSDGAGTMIEAINLRGQTGQDEIVFNEVGVDLDWRVEGNAGTNALHFDATNEDFTLASDAILGWSATTDATAADSINLRRGAGVLLEIRGTPGTVIGGFPSGSVHVTSLSADVNANSVITGHNLFGGNKQLWYIGSLSGGSDAIGIINRQNASLGLFTNSLSRMSIGGDGVFTFGASSSVTSAELLAWVVDPSGTGPAVFGTSPTLTTPVLATPTIAGNMEFAPGGTVLGARPSVEVVITTKTTTLAESGETYTNTGDADGSTFTLLNDPTIGATWTFVAMEAQTMTISPSAGETIEANGSVCADVRIGAAVGESITLQAAEGGAGGVYTPIASHGGFTCTP